MSVVGFVGSPHSVFDNAALVNTIIDRNAFVVGSFVVARVSHTQAFHGKPDECQVPYLPESSDSLQIDTYYDEADHICYVLFASPYDLLSLGSTLAKPEPSTIRMVEQRTL